jgi:hypothetical protein
MKSHCIIGLLEIFDVILLHESLVGFELPLPSQLLGIHEVGELGGLSCGVEALFDGIVRALDVEV